MCICYANERHDLHALFCVFFMFCSAVYNHWAGPYFGWLFCWVNFLRVYIENAKMKNSCRLLSLLFPYAMAIGNSICPNILVPQFELVTPIYRIRPRHSVAMIAKPPVWNKAKFLFRTLSPRLVTKNLCSLTVNFWVV